MADDSLPVLELAACRVDLVRGVVHRGDERTQLSSRELDLLRHLAANPGRVVARDELLTSVWGYSDAVVSRACDNSMHRLRAKIEGDPARPVHLLTAFGEGYRFEHLSAPVPAPPPAQELPPAPLLDQGFALGERTIDLPRLRVVGREGESALTHQEAQLLQRLHAARGAVVARDTLMREIWGQHTASRAVDSAVRRLRSKIEPDPSEPRYLLTERGGGYRLSVPVPAPAPPREGLVGRNQELTELEGLLTRARWVLVTGPGGIGKTRVVRQLAGERAGGVCWVDLAQADTEGSVLLAVARALSIQLSVDAREQIARVLGRQQGLLVLDNLEQVADEVAPLVSSWLDAAPALVLVGTSRIRLGLDHEVVLELSPLALDDAVALFLTRTRATWPSLRIRPEHDELVRTLVQRLDGLPLALELAAARVGALGLEGLLDRIDRRLDLLARPRGEEQRHRSLRAVLAGSWELLAPLEAEALLVSARFRDGFTVDDAEGLLGEHAIDHLQTLRDHSLVHLREDGRFGIYESIRLFADEQRTALPDGGRALDLRWVGWMSRLGDPALRRILWLRGQEGLARRQRMVVEDLERAADLAVSWGEGELAACALAGAVPVRQRFGPYGELAKQMERVLHAMEAGTITLLDATRAHLLTTLGALYFLLDQDADTVRVCEQALALVPPDAFEIRATAYALLGRQLPETPQQRPIAESLERAAEMYAHAGRPDLAGWFRARAMRRRGERGEAPVLEQALIAAQQIGDRDVTASITQGLADEDEAQGRMGLARRRYLEVFELLQQAERPTSATDVGLHVLRVIAFAGDRDAFDSLVERVLALIDRMGSRLDEARCWMYVTQARTAQDRLSCAQAAALRARQAFADCGPVPRTLAHFELREAELMLALQEPSSAHALAESARAQLSEVGEAEMATLAKALVGRSLSEMGRVDEALALADQAVQEAERASCVSHALCLLHRGHVRVKVGEQASAGADLARAEALIVRAGYHRPDSVPGVQTARLKASLDRRAALTKPR